MTKFVLAHRQHISRMFLSWQYKILNVKTGVGSWHQSSININVTRNIAVEIIEQSINVIVFYVATFYSNIV